MSRSKFLVHVCGLPVSYLCLPTIQLCEFSEVIFFHKPLLKVEETEAQRSEMPEVVQLGSSNVELES